MQTTSLSGGFANPATQSAHTFRSVMEAMARPGTIQNIEGALPPAPLSPAAGAVLLTLFDSETPIYLAGEMDCDAVRAWLSFHMGAPFAGPAQCIFAVGKWEALGPLSIYPIGTSEYPDRSATLIVDSAQLSASGARLTGPGIRDHAALSLPVLEAFQANNLLFPLGLDFIFTNGSQLVALPRSTQVSRLGSKAGAQIGAS
jgi:alpha-D-ribose 1-methylphosphonate 5-triphosphate synthase subunit PhnH